MIQFNLRQLSRQIEVNGLVTKTRRRRNPILRRGFHLIHSGVLVLLAVRVGAVWATPTQTRPDTAHAGETPLQLEYRLRVTRPTTHLAEVEIDARSVSTPTLDFVTPAWSPGRYAIYDFAKNVQEFEAFSADGRALDWSQPDKQT